MDNLHPVVQQIRDLLEERGYTYTYIEHEAVRTSEEAAAQRPEYSLGQGAKALIVRVKDRTGESSFIQVVIPGDRKFDSKKLCTVLDIKSVTFATKEQADELTGGIEFGGVPPFGTLFTIPVYVDDSLLENEEIIFNCGDRRASIVMRSADWRELINPTIIDIV